MGVYVGGEGGVGGGDALKRGLYNRVYSLGYLTGCVKSRLIVVVDAKA